MFPVYRMHEGITSSDEFRHWSMWGRPAGSDVSSIFRVGSLQVTVCIYVSVGNLWLGRGSERVRIQTLPPWGDGDLS